jgi:hypothetical protein
MTLPDLPKQNKTNEAEFGLKLKKWMKNNPMFSCSLEAKQTCTNSIPFKEVTNEQLAWGMSIRSNEGIMVRVQGSSGEPDYIWCRNMPSFIMIKFPKFFCLIAVPVFIMEKEKSKRKSLTAERAVAIAVKVVK